MMATLLSMTGEHVPLCKLLHLNTHDVYSLISSIIYRFAFARAPTSIDVSQDITVSLASHMDGNTTIIFNRPRNSGDSNDIPLDVCRFFLFAFGGAANIDTQEVGYHGFNRRFVSPERICVPTFAQCSGKSTCTLLIRHLIMC